MMETAELQKEWQALEAMNMTEVTEHLVSEGYDIEDIELRDLMDLERENAIETQELIQNLARDVMQNMTTETTKTINRMQNRVSKFVKEADEEELKLTKAMAEMRQLQADEANLERFEFIYFLGSIATAVALIVCSYAIFFGDQSPLLVFSS